MVPRVALISDGKENKGSIARAAWQAQQLGIPIDTFALAGRAKPALRLESVSLPVHRLHGRTISHRCGRLRALRRSRASRAFRRRQAVSGKPQVNLERGENPLRLHASLNTPGALDLSVAIQAGAPGRSAFRSGRGPAPAESSVRLAGSRRAGRQPSRRADRARSSTYSAPAIRARFTWTDFQLVISQQLGSGGHSPPTAKWPLEQYVKQGGGLLVIGGERNLYREKKGPEDALERTLPAKLAPPRSPEGTAVVLIIDKSSSMEGKKMELARASRHRRGRESAPHRSGRRADLRQLLRMGRAHPPRRRQSHHQAPDLRHHARRRHADRARA